MTTTAHNWLPFFLFFWPCSLQDLSSPSRDVTQAPAVKTPSLNHWPQGNSPWMTLLTLPQPCLPLLLSYRTRRIFFQFFFFLPCSILLILQLSVQMSPWKLSSPYFLLSVANIITEPSIFFNCTSHNLKLSYSFYLCVICLIPLRHTFFSRTGTLHLFFSARPLVSKNSVWCRTGTYWLDAWMMTLKMNCIYKFVLFWYSALNMIFTAKVGK